MDLNNRGVKQIVEIIKNLKTKEDKYANYFKKY